MKSLTFFIIFHDNVFQENTSGFTSGEMKEYFTWLAVNEKVPKIYPSWIPNHIREWEMKKHSPLFQMLNFYQNSVFYHLLWNPELIESKYIGFGQYDMKISAPEFRQMTHRIDEAADFKGDTVFAPFLYDFSALYSSPIDLIGWTRIFLTPYNNFYATNHTMERLSKLPLALLHTFIIPKWFFLHMMPFVESLTPEILRTLGWETRHLAGTLERIFALCISCAVIEGNILHLVDVKGFQHVEGQHSEDKLRGLGLGLGKEQGIN